jgi:hypothetical protein
LSFSLRGAQLSEAGRLKMFNLAVMSLWGALLFAKLFPETPTGRRLHKVSN